MQMNVARHSGRVDHGSPQNTLQRVRTAPRDPAGRVVADSMAEFEPMQTEITKSPPRGRLKCM